MRWGPDGGALGFEVIAASGPPADNASVLPAVAAQGLLSLDEIGQAQGHG